jgi:hypothetical protein
MGATLRSWLTGALAGLFVLAVVQAPAQHARVVAERAAFSAAHAMPHGTSSGIHHDEASDGHGRHMLTPACFACVIMAAPGLPVASSAQASRIGVAARVVDFGEAVAPREVGWAPQRARAPPAGFIA